MSFNNSSGFSFKGRNTFNNLHGDQVNTTITAEIVNIHGHDTTATFTKNTIFEEFDYVKLGHVISMKDLGSVDLSQWDWHFQNGELVRRRARKTISTIQVHPNQQSKFTAIRYEGEDAQEAWEKDFKQFSRASRTGSFQLFGINQSDVPMLIFHHELIPAAHCFTNTFWMNMYIYYLSEKKSCDPKDLWLNTSNGVLCEGPTGPDIRTKALQTRKSVIQALPSTVDMLEEGSFITFFSKFGSDMDRSVLFCAWRFAEETYLDDFFPKTTQDHQREDNNHPQLTTNHPYLEDLWRNPPHYLPIDIIGGLRFDTIYSHLLEPVARWPQEAPGRWKWWDNVNGLLEKTRVDGGLTRFKLDDQGEGVLLKAIFSGDIIVHGWSSQSSRVFDFLKTTCHRENFSVVYPPWQLCLYSTRCEYEAYDRLLDFSDLCDGNHSIAVEEARPIYLFLYPLPMSISELISWAGGHTHFWSFDEDGRSRILEEKWKRWGIPTLIPYCSPSVELRSWPTHLCTALHKWQIARGFDPSTADWARECGYPEFEIVGAKKCDRFEEISELPEKSGWSLSRLWTAIPGSDISACAC